MHQLVTLDLALLDDLPGNPQQLTGDAKYTLIRSIARNGFVEPVLVTPRNERYLIVSGNHRVDAARDLGMHEVPAVVAELTDEEITRLAVELNTIKGTPDTELLLKFLDGYDGVDIFFGDLDFGTTLDAQDVFADDVETEGPDDVPLQPMLLGHILISCELDQLDGLLDAIKPSTGLAQIRVARGT